MTIQARHQLGRTAEHLACLWFLKNKNALLLARNYRTRRGEIDLIFEEYLSSGNSELVFVEVRARSHRNWTLGPESIDLWKQQNLKNTVNHFLSHYRGRAQSVRLDLLAWDGADWTYVPNLWI